MNRKDEHVSLAKAFHQERANDFDAVRLIHQSFPENDVAEVTLATEIFETTQSVPFFINAMTGGSEKTGVINQQLAQVAKATGLMMATGSVSAALKEPASAKSFTVVRETYPEGFLLANIGLNHTVSDAQKAVELFQANALQVHLNSAQELVMPEGDRSFSHWLSNLEAIVKAVPVPVVVKEVGFGMTRETVQQILSTGVTTIDVSGCGGTSFTQIENARRSKREMSYLDNYGQSTVISLLEAKEVPQSFDLIASGGIRNAYDIFKSLCLGAKTVGISGTILQTLLTEGEEKTIEQINGWQEELRLLYTLAGKTATCQLKQVPLLFSDSVLSWCQARKINPQKYSLR